MKQVTTIGLDLAKNIFQVHGVDAAGGIVVRKRLRRGQVLIFFNGLPHCLFGMEACATAHNCDAADAEAICEAVRRPTMRFVPVKTVEQQSALLMHRARDLLIRQRTMMINALRGHPKTPASLGALRTTRVIRRDNPHHRGHPDVEAACRTISVLRPDRRRRERGRDHGRSGGRSQSPQRAFFREFHRHSSSCFLAKSRAMTARTPAPAEFGIVAAQGRQGVMALMALVGDDTNASVPAVARRVLKLLVGQIGEAGTQLAAIEEQIAAWHKNNPVSQRLATIPGVGQSLQLPSWRQLPIRANSAAVASSLPGSDWCRDKTRLAVRPGLVASASEATVIFAGC